ncbi:MAG: PAS domain S-box protein [Exilispira sp.]
MIIFFDANNSFERMTGLKLENIIGKKVTEVLQGIENDSFNWIKAYGEMAIYSGELELEQYSSILNKYYKVYAYSPQKGYFITTFIDITSLKKDEENLNR